VNQSPRPPKGKRRRTEIVFDKTKKYNLVKNGKVVYTTDCVHDARDEAKKLKAQFWHIQRSGVPVFIFDYGKV
jgi:hypothetical protein